MASTLPPNPITTTLDAGSAAFATFWRRWRHQWSQPQLLKIADAYIGARLFHSSQMGGFETRALQNPAPRVFFVVGYLNLAHARSLGIDEALLEKVPDIGLAPKLPDTLRDLWQGRQPLCTPSGEVLGPSGLFMAFCGLLELPGAAQRSVAPEHAVDASAIIGRFLRFTLPTKGIDWLADLSRIEAQCETAKELLLGHPVSAQRLEAAMPQIAEIAGVEEDVLWEQFQAG